MIIAKDVFENMINSPVRSLRGRVEIYQGSTLALICGCHDRLRSFTIERIGDDGKFFGYGVCQKLNVHLLDKERELDITTANTLEVEFGVGSDYIYPCPNFYVTEVRRDENTNELSITAYDALYKATQYKVADLDIVAPYTIRDFAEACATFLGVPVNKDSVAGDAFNTVYSTGANFEGTETIREALNAVAEATQTVYYINHNWELVFKKLDVNGAPVAVIDREKYITLDSKTNRRLATIAHITDLGDNVSASTEATGSTQYVRDNPFWSLRDDIGTLVNNALANVGGLTINQFELSWRGNYLLEIGDKIELITKDNSSVMGFILDDTLEFNGSLSGATRWSYTDNEEETETNSASMGDFLKQTYARVDKANKQIELVAKETSTATTNISQLILNTDGISATVESLTAATEENVTDINEKIEEIAKKTSVSVTEEDVKVLISKGTSKVQTATGFTFDDNGLTITKSESEVSTTITENGMVIEGKNSDKPLLTVNNQGINAKDLHATTYLIIGENSRFEDYNNKKRTGCFWIGG